MIRHHQGIMQPLGVAILAVVFDSRNFLRWRKKIAVPGRRHDFWSHCPNDCQLSWWLWWLPTPLWLEAILAVASHHRTGGRRSVTWGTAYDTISGLKAQVLLEKHCWTLCHHDLAGSFSQCDGREHSYYHSLYPAFISWFLCAADDSSFPSDDWRHWDWLS